MFCKNKQTVKFILTPLPSHHCTFGPTLCSETSYLQKPEIKEKIEKCRHIYFKLLWSSCLGLPIINSVFVLLKQTYRKIQTKHPLPPKKKEPTLLRGMGLFIRLFFCPLKSTYGILFRYCKIISWFLMSNWVGGGGVV